MNRKERRAGEKSVRSNPLSTSGQATMFYNLGVELQGAGQLAQAIGCYERALQHRPDADAANNLGNSLTTLGRTAEAVGWYQRAIEINRRHPLAHFNLGNALRALGRIDEAITAYRHTLTLKPDYADAHNNLGVALQAQGRWDEASACYYMATGLNPKHAFAWHNLGNALRKQGRRKEAIPCYERAIELDPAYADPQSRLASALRKERRWDAAIAAYRRLIELKPGDGDAQHQLGLCLKARGRPEDAVVCYRQAQALEPGNAILLNNLGNAFKDLEAYEEAIACYRSAAAADPDLPEVHINLATYRRSLPDPADIERLNALLADRRLSQDKKNQVLFHLGRAYNDLGRYAEAFGYFRRANEEMAARLPFDVTGHHAKIAAIKSAFPEPAPAEPVSAGAPAPLFVVGLSRAGKSLVEAVLKTHPAVYAAGEKHTWYNALDEIKKPRRLRGVFPDFVEALTPEDIAWLGQRYLENIAKLSPGAQFYVNTLPGHYHQLGLLARALPGARFIACRRDPLDQCLTIYFKRYSASNAHAYDFRNIAGCWADCEDLMAHWRALYDDRILTVQYEDLVRDTAAVAAEIFRHCGIDGAGACALPAFSADEVGRWRNYETHIGELRDALDVELARVSSTPDTGREATFHAAPPLAALAPASTHGAWT